MLYTFLSSDTKEYLKKLDNFNHQYQKHQDLEGEIVKLKNTLKKLEQKYEEYKDDWQNISNKPKETLQHFCEDFVKIYKEVAELVDDYERQNQALSTLNFLDFDFLLDKKAEIVGKCFDEAFQIINSKKEIGLMFQVKELKELKEKHGSNEKINTKIDKKQNELEVSKDKQLVAEKILQELGIIREGKRSREMQEEVEVIQKLMGMSRLLDSSDEKAKILKKSIQRLESMQEQIYSLNESFSQLHNQIFPSQASDSVIEATILDPIKMEEIRRKIEENKAQRKERAEQRPEIKREIEIARRSPLEKKITCLFNIVKRVKYIPQEAMDSLDFLLLKSLTDGIAESDLKAIRNSEEYKKEHKKAFQENWEAEVKFQCDLKYPTRARLKKKLAGKYVGKSTTKEDTSYMSKDIIQLVQYIENETKKIQEEYKHSILLLREQPDNQVIKESCDSQLKLCQSLKSVNKLLTTLAPWVQMLETYGEENWNILDIYEDLSTVVTTPAEIELQKKSNKASSTLEEINLATLSREMEAQCRE